jgi:DNA polymerase-1
MAGDCIYPHQIAKKQIPLLRERGLDQVVALEHNMIPVIADMELTGIPFDRAYWVNMLQENTVVRDKCISTLNAYLKTHSLAQGNLFGGDDLVTQLKFDSPQKLAKALAAVGFDGFVSPGGQALSTSSQRLKLMKIEGHLPADLVDAILDYRRVEKRITSYGGNFLKSVDDVTGRIHPDFTQAILVTGRMSCSPGMQTIPKDQEYRQAFDSPDGWTLIVLDASQIEARISADTTGDEPAIAVFQRGGDIYKEDGEAFYNTSIDRGTEEGEKLRDRAKASWLGLSYGQGKNKFHTYSRLFLGEDLDKTDTDFLYGRFFEVHWKMKEVMDEWSSYVDPTNSGRYIIDDFAAGMINEEKAGPMLLEALTKRAWGDEKTAAKQVKRLLANKHKVRYAETILGRKRFFRADFLGWWTAGRNMPIQGTAADIQKATMLAFQNFHWKQNFDAHIINVVHDEIITLVREEQAEDLFHEQVRIGEAVGQKFLQRVPMKVDGGITRHWKKF